MDHEHDGTEQVTEEITEATSIYASAWKAHTHPEAEQEWMKGPHIHSPDADWAVQVELAMLLTHEDKGLDAVGLMEFRGVTMNMRAALEEQRKSTDLAEKTAAERQFAIIAYNVDLQLTNSLLATVDQALAAHGVTPPCQLQPVKSSNIRSIGFVITQKDDEPVPSQGVLYVAFHGGGLYAYDEVPIAVAQDFVEAESKGAYFADHIRGQFDFRKVIAKEGA